MRRIIVVSLFILVALVMVNGCHAQVAPTNTVVVLTWTQPSPSGSWSGCTASSPCTYVISRASSVAGACPATTGTNYTPLNQSSPASGLTYTDMSVSGSTLCYIAQTLQSGLVSMPSNTAGPFVIPANPVAPAITGATQQ